MQFTMTLRKFLLHKEAFERFFSLCFGGFVCVFIVCLGFFLNAISVHLREVPSRGFFALL